MTVCYCCTCRETDLGRLIWDPACPNHGAHGVRGCERHGTKTQPCDDCGYPA